MIAVFFTDILWSMNYDLSILDVRMPAITKKPLFGSRTFFTMQETNLTYPILMLLLIGSGLVYGFSKERLEDEMISDLRKESLVWAVYVNYIVLLISLFLLFDFDMIGLIIINVFTLLIFFILRFEWKKYQLKRASHEE
jgi:hypothetical protein